jgi:hypothetical protein
MRRSEPALRALVTGSVASVASTLALAVLGSLKMGKPAAMTNATSHWLWGDAAFDAHEPSLKHTAIGYLTHHASAIFWATLLESLLRRRAPTPVEIAGKAALTTAIAATVDYGLTPPRLRPGFEQHLSRSSLALVFAVFGAGLAAGAWLQTRRQP